MKARSKSFAELAMAFASILMFSYAVRADDAMRIQRPVDSQATTTEVSPQFDIRSQTMQIRIAVPGPPPNQQPDRPLNSTANALQGGLTQLELHRLAAHDIVLLIDKSGSMATPDCPLSASGTSKLGAFSSLVLGLGGMSASRWDWCLRQTSHMAKQTEDVLAKGFTVVLFDSRFAIFPHVTVQQLAKIFNENGPGGGTDLAQPLESTFDDYFKRKRRSNGNVKPLLIGVITDGCPNNPDAVRQVIISVTRAVRDPNEITVVFFLIGGNDRRGERFVWDLSHNLVNQGAPYQVVKAVPFYQLEKLGLARALADNLD